MRSALIEKKRERPPHIHCVTALEEQRVAGARVPPQRLRKLLMRFVNPDPLRRKPCFDRAVADILRVCAVKIEPVTAGRSCAANCHMPFAGIAANRRAAGIAPNERSTASIASGLALYTSS